MVNVGRNEPCPCGSGKKYKHCCGRAKASAPYSRMDRAAVQQRLDAAMGDERWEAEGRAMIREFWGPLNHEDGAEEEVLNYMSQDAAMYWFCFDRRLPDGSRFCDHFVAETFGLTQGELAQVEEVKRSTMSLYEVEASTGTATRKSGRGWRGGTRTGRPKVMAGSC